MIEVDDIEATLERVERSGGRRRYPENAARSGWRWLRRTDSAHGVRAAQEFEDPEGNLVGIIQR